MIIIVWVSDVNDGKDQNEHRKKKKNKKKKKENYAEVEAWMKHRKKMAMNRFIKYTIFLSIAIVYYLIHSFHVMAETPKATLKWRNNRSTGSNEDGGWRRRDHATMKKRKSFIIDIAIIKLCFRSTRLHFYFSLKHSVFFFPPSARIQLCCHFLRPHHFLIV